jgi:hypothetical protein
MGLLSCSISVDCYAAYCVMELPTAAKVLVAFDPMSRTVAATSTRMTAIITAYSAMS